jgi:hypothetical protein
MSIRGDQVAGLYQRRGQLIQWIHTTGTNATSLNPFSRGPAASVGISQPDPTGTFGENLQAPVIIRGYFSHKVHTSVSAAYGIIDSADAQLDFAVPYPWEPALTVNLTRTSSPSLSDYNEGRFATFTKEKSVTFDRFIIHGLRWVAKAQAIPLIDDDTVIAWRLLISRESI